MTDNILYAGSEANVSSFNYAYTANTFRDLFELIAFLPQSDMVAINVGQLQKIFGIKEGDRLINHYENLD